MKKTKLLFLAVVLLIFNLALVINICQASMPVPVQAQNRNQMQEPKLIMEERGKDTTNEQEIIEQDGVDMDTEEHEMVGEDEDVTSEQEAVEQVGVNEDMPIKNQNQIREQEHKVIKVQNMNQLQEAIQVRRGELQTELKNESNKNKQKVFQNQNTVREAVHALLISEDLEGGIGKQVSAIAMEFNNSVEKTIQAEENIVTRGGWKRFFVGGDKDAAEEIKDEVAKNKERIQELKELHENNWLQSEVRETLQEQIQNMEGEQNRLEQMANKELQKKGVWGWIVNLFK